MFIDSSEYLLKKICRLRECTCSFPVACDNQALVEFFSRAPLSQLLPMEPDQQHPVPMFLVAVLTCEQTPRNYVNG